MTIEEIMSGEPKNIEFKERLPESAVKMLESAEKVPETI